MREDSCMQTQILHNQIQTSHSGGNARLNRKMRACVEWKASGAEAAADERDARTQSLPRAASFDIPITVIFQLREMRPLGRLGNSGLWTNAGDDTPLAFKV